MARPLKPLVKSGGYYPSNRWTPLVYPGGYTTANGGGQPEPEAVLKTVTGSLIHITDALAKPAQALSVKLEPIQDLHGYDNPWPAGGGKNKLPYPYYTQDGTLSGVTFSTAQDGKITASGTTTEGVNFFLARDISLAAGTYTLSIDGTHTALSLLARNSDANIMLASIAPSKTTATFTLEETANVRLYFNTSTVGVSVSISAYVQLEAGSTATAYAPYSNICPISGRTSATVTRTGKNLFDKSKYQNLENVYEYTDGSYHCKSIQLTPNTTYTISQTATETSTALILMNKYFHVNQSGFFDLRKAGDTKTYTTDETGKLYIGTATTDAATNSRIDECNIQIETGSTASAYEPYQGNTYTIQLGDTVYGGTLDVTGGKMVVTHGVKMLDGSENWSWSANNSLAAVAVQNGIVTNGVTQYNSYTQNSTFNDKSWAARSSVDGSIGMFYGASQIYAKYSEFTTAAEAKAFFTENPTTVVYELATPIEITLTPTQITTLLGTNNIWSDAGDSTLTYYAEGNASTSEALGILLGGTYNNPGGADDVSDDKALEILLGGS